MWSRIPFLRIYFLIQSVSAVWCLQSVSYFYVYFQTADSNFRIDRNRYHPKHNEDEQSKLHISNFISESKIWRISIFPWKKQKYLASTQLRKVYKIMSKWLSHRHGIAISCLDVKVENTFRHPAHKKIKQLPALHLAQLCCTRTTNLYMKTITQQTTQT